MKKASLARFEALAQRLVEDSFKRLFSGRLEVAEVAARLAQALEDSQVDGRVTAQFVIHLHPFEYEAISRQGPALLEKLADYAATLARQTGLMVVERPQIELQADVDVPRHEVRVRARRSGEQGKKLNTQLFPADSAGEEMRAALEAADAFLILEGRRHLPLDRPVITIGRRTDNDIVLDSAAVSRRHAQIRWRYNRFVLYDLSMRGRTAVNGQPVAEYVLQPGDVITMSNITFIYGEGRGEKSQRVPLSGADGGQTLITPDE